MTWKICSMLALLRLSDARSVATEALRTADFIKAVQVVMCSRQRRDNVEEGSTGAIPAFMCPVKYPTVGGDLAESSHAQEER
jgi:hypothetical protein